MGDNLEGAVSAYDLPLEVLGYGGRWWLNGSASPGILACSKTQIMHNHGIAMSTTQMETREGDYSTMDVPAGETKHDDASLVSEAFECKEYAGPPDNPVEMQAAASEQDGTMMTSARALGFDHATTADDSRGFSTKQIILSSLPKVTKTEEEATILPQEDNTGHVTAPVSSTHVNQDVTSTVFMASNQAESFEMPATGKLEGGKYIGATFHDLEENQVAEHAYDMDFDIDAHDMPLEESFFDENCIFPALDADKTEVWHAGVDDVIMEESSAQPHTNQHPQDVDVKSLPQETNNEPVAVHEAKENVHSNEEWPHNTQQQPVCEMVFVDAPHRVDEASDLSNRRVQDHEAIAAYPCNETGGETLASDVVQDKELTGNYSKVEDAQEVQVQYDTDDIFSSLASANVETAHNAESCEAKRPEEEVSTEIAVKEVKFESTSINVTQEDAAVHLGKLDEHMHGDPCVCKAAASNSDALDAELHLKLGDSLEDSKRDSCIVLEDIVTEFKGQDKGASQGSGCSDFVKKDEYSDMRSIKATAGDQLVAIDSLGACRAISPKPDYVPVSSEQGESTLVSVWRDMSTEAVSEPLAQEYGSTLEQNVMHDKLAAISSASQHVSSQGETGTLHMKTVQSQSDEPVVEDGKPVHGIDGGVLVVRNNDGKEIFESENESMKVSKNSEQEAKVLNKEHDHSEMKCVDVFDGSVPEPSIRELKKIDVSSDEIEGGKIADFEDKPLKEEPKQDDGRSQVVLEGSVAEMRKSVADEIFDRGDGILEGEVSVAEQEIVAPGEEPEEHSLMPLAGTSFLQAENAEESKKEGLSAEALIHVSSSSAPEANASSGNNLHEKESVMDGLNGGEKAARVEEPKDGEKSAPVEEQSSVPLDQSIEVRSIAPSKKQSEKVISGEKVPKSKLSKKFKSGTVKETKEGGYAGDSVHAKSRSGEAEESSVKKAQKPAKQGSEFGIGDLVWAKVRSHPWWPAQIFDPADASKSARKAKKSGRVLVAFFGDCTFAWVQQSQMIAFRPNFKEKVQQTTMRIFCLAVEEALEELCRRSELGLSCRHFKGAMHSTSSFPDANTGIREGVRIERFKDIRASAEMFRPKKTLDFVKNVAAAPLGAWSSTLQWAESRGHAYGLRTCMVTMQGLDLAPVLLTPPAEPSKGSKLKRSHSSLNAEDVPEAGDRGKESKKTKKLKSDKDRKDSEGKGFIAKAVSEEENKQVSSDNVARVKSDMKVFTDTRERNKDRNIIKIKLGKKMKSDHLSSSEKRPDSPSVEEAGGEKISDDSKETLLAIASHSTKVLKRSSLKEEKISGTLKKVRREIGEEKKNDASMYQASKANRAEGFSDLDADASLRTEVDTEDAYNFLPSPSKDRVKRTKGSKMSVEFESKKDVPVKDTSAGKNESLRKFSKVGDSIRRVASELKGTSVVKVVEDVRHTGPDVTEDLEELPRERQASPMGNQVLSKELSEDVSLLQLRRDLELLAKKAGGAKGKMVKVSKKRDQAEAVAGKSLPQWQSVPQRSQRSCVQELALAARKRKSELVHDEILSKLPKNSSTSVSQRHHASKGYITSAEKPGERRSYDKSLLLYSRKPAPPASSTKISSQRYDEKLSSHAPLGLFMRFPENFPLPSESQLKATFIPFGPLQMSATRLYKDSASAQVVFKHGRDAESALKHAKKNSMFGQVTVTYRLRHLSHSARIEMKTDHPSSNKAHASQVAMPKESASSRDKLGGASALSEKRTGDKEVVSSTVFSSSNHESQSGSNPMGDIQDQMMTLLRQVSVIVNTSPVTSDGP
ncbi:hypothetical protein GOP47_0012750 [Adiantum capillus-veneris]|uniref:PWWP domain-containing protein n=1 Tax=Adiantum capillus-veneris TaxID=13818 RepID=A0A9D4URP8_ADICA|nr:hypothetical protein GOP47_0012750 [Adiantum capillus-veneris]